MSAQELAGAIAAADFALSRALRYEPLNFELHDQLEMRLASLLAENPPPPARQPDRCLT